MDRIEHVHRFTRAVSVGNPREFLQAEKEDQEMAEACKRLMVPLLEFNLEEKRPGSRRDPARLHEWALNPRVYQKATVRLPWRHRRRLRN
jgi:hypothetical protein